MADFHPETLHSIHTSKETAHIADRVQGTPGMNALPKMLIATNARGWDTMSGYATPNLETGSNRVLKLYWSKVYTRLGNKNMKTACQVTLLI